MSPEASNLVGAVAAWLTSIVIQSWFPYASAFAAAAWVLARAKGWTPRDIGLAGLYGAAAFVLANVLQTLLTR